MKTISIRIEGCKVYNFSLKPLMNGTEIEIDELLYQRLKNSFEEFTTIQKIIRQLYNHTDLIVK